MAIFTNQASLSYNGTVTNSNIVTGELVQVLSASKTALGSTYTPGGTVSYIISIVNAGTTDYAGLTLTDNLGAYTVGTETVVPLTYLDGTARLYVNGVLQNVPTTAGGPPLVIGGFTVPAGGNVILVYEAAVNGYASPASDGRIDNTAVISGGGLGEPLTVTDTLQASQAAVLTISKAICPETVVENGTVTYTFVIQNNGSIAAGVSDSVSVSDVFEPVLNLTGVWLDGVLLTEPVDYTYDPVTGSFSTVPGRITVEPASYTQDADGIWRTTPGYTVLRITGTV